VKREWRYGFKQFHGKAFLLFRCETAWSRITRRPENREQPAVSGLTSTSTSGFALFQKNTHLIKQIKPNSLPSLLASTAAEELNCNENELEYWAWPQVYGSTTGPFGGLGGQALTTFTIEAWHNGAGKAVLFCQGKRLRTTAVFEPLMWVGESIY